jgi:hypothetical protein
MRTFKTETEDRSLQNQEPKPKPKTEKTDISVRLGSVFFLGFGLKVPSPTVMRRTCNISVIKLV